MHVRPANSCLFALLALLVLAEPVLADVELPAVFGDHMVVQGDRPIVVWGWAKPGERVSVRLGSGRASTRADNAGDWRVVLDPLPAGGPHVLLVRGRNTVRCADVLVGEVWICSGQSNMAWPVKAAKDAPEEIAAARFPEIRLCAVERTTATTPQTAVPTKGWAACGPATVKHFSAVAYYFGREIHRETGIPVGLIHTSWGGTTVEAWTPRGALQATSPGKHLLQQWEMRVEEWEASGEGKDPRTTRHHPTVLHNAMIAPLVPLSFRGAIWYQGESNAREAWDYRTLFPAMIQAWRTAWDAGDFPFYFVQLPNWHQRTAEPGESKWAELRDAQLHTLEVVPRTGMAVAIDLGEANDLHPKNKQEVGRRLALWALANDYGLKVAHSGPLFESLELDGRKAVLRFRHAENGLRCPEEELPKGFAIAGEDRVWYWAKARIEGDRVICLHPKVREPRAVRYAWANNPEANLQNGAGLPASPFRTDDWPLTTQVEGRPERDGAEAR